ncbi:MAG TPA: aromatic amino acid ammonia-lyase [bacterium]|nr:aromatic amino acid ammonia-lyase [bacterium]HPS30151.1 aromatic amino acid ammonia-lyase [bacterium]
MAVIGGKYLNLEEFYGIVIKNEKVELSNEAVSEVEKSFIFLKEFAKNRTIYGVNTGFGPMARYKINDSDVEQLQLNLIRSHCAGSGKILPEIYARAAVLARLNSLMLAYSGVHSDTVKLLAEFLNNNISPVIYEHGGVGASGDLVQLAHLALNLIGEGDVYHHGHIVQASSVFEKLGLKPLRMHLREGLALINGTSVMTGIGIMNLIMSKRVLNWMVAGSSIMMEVVGCYDDHYSVQTNSVKLHQAQNAVSVKLSKLLNGSLLVKSRKINMYEKELQSGYIDEKVQEFYSIRCVPQVLGPVLDTLDFSEKILFDELNSVNDNPVIDHNAQFVFHGGNFHGDYVSFEMDKMKTAITKLTMLSERQINYLMNPKLNEKLPPFVNLGRLGFNYGMQAVQFTAVSTTAESQTLCFPNYIHSISSNNDNQDIVSMGTNSANIARTVIENAFEVVSIELIALIQAVDCLDCSREMSENTRDIYHDLRKVIPVFKEDSPRHHAVRLMREYIYYNDLKI